MEPIILLCLYHSHYQTVQDLSLVLFYFIWFISFIPDPHSPFSSFPLPIDTYILENVHFIEKGSVDLCMF